MNLAAELRVTGVTVNAYRPGGVDTAMQTWIRRQDPGRIGAGLPERFKSLLAWLQRRSPASSIASTITRSRFVRSAATSRPASCGERILGSVRGTRTSGMVRDRLDPP